MVVFELVYELKTIAAFASGGARGGEVTLLFPTTKSHGVNG